MALSSGQRLGPYEILSPIGAGGMGEVYRARDPRLGRDIAIKVVPAELASDPERLMRFEREARAASALSHPNIIAVYDVGTADSVSYMAIELIDGDTLQDLLQQGPLPIRKLLEIAVQIADGLAAAHDAGIVHRDLKPLNVMVSRAGFVKILDFGLAKVPGTPFDASANSRSGTVAPGTTAGVILGTTDYMSPEQARGVRVDFRSDQFSFGAVLYEMATGQRAFGRETQADTLSAILHQEPAPVAQLRRDAPAPLRWIIERCLAKSASDRYASTHDLARELRALKEHIGEISERVSLPDAQTPKSRTAPFVVAALALVAAAAVWFLWSGQFRRPIEPQFRRLTFRRGFVSSALFVPNSNAILYAAGWEGQPGRTYMTLPESGSLDRALDAEPQLPMSWSTDGSQVLVLLGDPLRLQSRPGRLAWWPALGGKARPVLENASWSDWAKKGKFLVVAEDRGTKRSLEVRDAEGRLRRTIFETQGAISSVRLSPDEKEVAFIHHPSILDIAGEVRIASIEARSSRTLTPIFPHCFGLVWNPRTNEIWFTASAGAMAATSLWSTTPAAKKRLVYAFADVLTLQDVSSDGGQCLLSSRLHRVRMLVRRADEAPRDLSWFDSTYVSDISPDEGSVLFNDAGPAPGMAGSWIRSVDGGDAVRVGEGEFGKFSPDGRWIVALTQARRGAPQLILHPTGVGQSRQLTFSSTNHFAPSFAGPHTILYVSSEPGTTEVWRMETDGTGAQSLGAPGCTLPMARPGGDSFVCVGGPESRSLLLYPLRPGEGRKLYELPGTARFRYAGWNHRGTQVLAVTSDRKVLTLDTAGAKIGEEVLPVDDESFQSLQTAAISAHSAVRAYSVASLSSNLYLASGLR